MTTKHFRLLLPLALAACGVKVNGKSYGLGGSSSGGGTSSSSSGSSSASSAESGSAESGSSGGTALAAGDSQCPEPSGITDPWAGVSNDRPVGIRNLVPQEHSADMECTAANDHCIRQCMWLQVPEKDAINSGIQTYFDEDTSAIDSFGPPWVAYRTVPATKRLLTPGAIVTFAKYPSKVPSASFGRYSSSWVTGKLDRVDWKAGKVYLVGSRDPGWLSATRVAVLEYREGGKVQIVGGRKRDELAVRKDEVFAPPADAPINLDPWSEVAANGFPKAQSDDQPLERDGTCTAATNHCLRSWAWLVDNGSGDRVWAARYDGTSFLSYEAVHNAPAKVSPLTGVVAAYRTVPAKKETLEKGMIVFNIPMIGGEESAHSRWEMAKVVRVEDDRDVRVEDSYGRVVPWTIASTRVAVVVWYPGEKAEKVEVAP